MVYGIFLRTDYLFLRSNHLIHISADKKEGQNWTQCAVRIGLLIAMMRVYYKNYGGDSYGLCVYTTITNQL